MTEPQKLLEIGNFKARPTEGALGKSTTKGLLQYALTFMFLEGPNSGKHITWWGGLEGKGFNFTMKALAAAGHDGKTKLNQWKPTKDVMLVIEHHSVPAAPAENGKPARAAKTIARVKYVNSLDGSGGGLSLDKFKMNAAEADAAADAILARSQAGNESAAQEATGFDTGGVGDDDIPF